MPSEGAGPTQPFSCVVLLMVSQEGKFFPWSAVPSVFCSRKQNLFNSLYALSPHSATSLFLLMSRDVKRVKAPFIRYKDFYLTKDTLTLKSEYPGNLVGSVRCYRTQILLLCCKATRDEIRDVRFQKPLLMFFSQGFVLGGGQQKFCEKLKRVQRLHSYLSEAHIIDLTTQN